MKREYWVGLVVLTGLAAVGCGNGFSSEPGSAGDGSPSGGSSSSGGEGSGAEGGAAPGGAKGDGDGGDGFTAAPECVLTDAAIEIGCAVHGDAIYVDAGAAAGGTGTRDEPSNSLAGALQLAEVRSISQLVLCDGVYGDALSLTADSTVRRVAGGFDCSTWLFSGDAVSRVRPTAGYALSVEVPADEVSLFGVTFEAPNATEVGQSSIAAFVKNSSNVALERVSLEAGTARDGADGTTAPYTVSNGWPNEAGKDATELGGGEATTVTCPGTGLTTAGGRGGTSRDTSLAITREPIEATAGEPDGGAAGTSTLVYNAPSSCLSGGSGATPQDSADDGPGATALGTLSAEGWHPEPGTAGATGLPGSGGGGGGYLSSCGAGGGGSGCSDVSNGGGGGPGGCGGRGGGGGQGGGSSIALLVLDSTVVLRGGELATLDAGNGGDGDGGQAGQPGAERGVRWTAPEMPISGCHGGRGGDGGAGGGGGGGAGGLSVGILWSGNEPTLEGEPTITYGSAGVGGVGAGANNDGDPGRARNSQTAQ